jgi:hypothetical protein
MFSRRNATVTRCVRGAWPGQVLASLEDLDNCHVVLVEITIGFRGSKRLHDVFAGFPQSEDGTVTRTISAFSRLNG